MPLTLEEARERFREICERNKSKASPGYSQPVTRHFADVEKDVDEGEEEGTDADP